MKLALVLSAVAAIAATSVSAQTQDTTTKDLRIASHSTLNKPTALVNKNTLATDNNVFIARSNVVFQQNDRMAMQQRVRDALAARLPSSMAMGKEQSDQSMASAVLTKSVMRAVSAPTTDASLMTKASAVVAAYKSNKDDQTTLTHRIVDFVDAVGLREMEQEQAIQSQTPRGVIVLVGTKDILRQPTAVVNKNVARSDDQVSVSRSRVAPQQNDQVVMAGDAKVASVVAPASAINVNSNIKQDDAEPMFRMKIVYPKDREADEAMAQQQQEQFGLWGPGWGMGWRYPLGYWNRFGAGLYGGGACGLGFARGPFFYC